MPDPDYANGVTAERLRIFLAFWPMVAVEFEEAHKILVEAKEKLLGTDAVAFNWSHLYEQPITKHIGFAFAGLPWLHPFSDWLKQIVETPGQISALPSVTREIDEYITDLQDPSEAETEEILPMLGAAFGVIFSVFSSLRSVLYHGCFLNELIERVRRGDDKALFDAIRIDPAVIGCLPAIQRISKATLLKDVRFFAKLKAAINGKIAKREQANFQKIRLVFEILHEAGATRLSDDQLHQLFVEELKLYASNDKGGGSAKALRKFADTYMKKNSTT